LLATFCDNILKKGCSEKLSDEAIEDALEKVHLSFFSFAVIDKLCARALMIDWFPGGEIAGIHQ